MVQTRKQRQVAEGAFKNESLIPGLPDEVALLCLARVKPEEHATLAGVCR
jgi:hypothetical protein